ncbi:MAG: cyclopropane-fatty-acyl-phospholipid synthase [Deltaproteobacteria bacterium]|nr:cyclopropane-fatty-acyl-phospholipid synthase [Deltaproteobacteria bacterium]
MSLGAALAERGYLPDSLVRYGIRRLDRKRLCSEDRGSPERNREAAREFVARLAESPLALHTREANEQHYELPPAFFARVLGPGRRSPTGWRCSSSGAAGGR